MKIKCLMFIIPVILTACSSFSIDRPGSFAAYRISNGVYRAISADGVRFRVRRIPNDAAGTAFLWSETAALHLKNAGYHELKNEPFGTTSALEGRSTEYLYRYNGENWIYRVVIFTDTACIYIAEAGGMEKYYRKHEKEIDSSLKTFRVKK